MPAVYHRPTSLEGALELLEDESLTVLAGGTDFYPSRVDQVIHEPIVDIGAVPGIRSIERLNDHWRIGAGVTWADIIEAALSRGFGGLQAAARQVGGVQIQSVGTIGGNLVNASPAADGVPPLLTLDATVELASSSGTRVVPLPEFLTGYRQTALEPGELVTGILVPTNADDAASRFLKLGARSHLVISIVMVSALIRATEGKIVDARIAVGACSPVAMRLTDLEAELIGRQANPSTVDLVSNDHLDVLTPIHDVRASADYRRHAALVLTKRAVAGCLE